MASGAATTMHGPPPMRHWTAAFTLIELITVVAIIGLLLGLIVPGAASLWSQRNESTTINVLRGLLASARSQAIRNGERGLFFFVNADGAQQVVFIEADPPASIEESQDAGDCDEIGADADCVSEVDALNRFRITSGKTYTIPLPYRVAPSWVLDDPLNPPPAAPARWPEQLEHKRFPGDAGGLDTPRYHRNYFTVIFDARGELVLGRDVLIHDVDGNDDDDDLGDQTRLAVQNVDQAWHMDATTFGREYENISPGTNPDLFDVIVLEDGRAANFISVGGLVVYDETDVEGFDGRLTIETLMGEAQPVYLSRFTGDIILGPKGGV